MSQRCAWAVVAHDTEFAERQNKSHALNDEIVVNALAGVVGVGVTYIKDDEDIVPTLKAGPRAAPECSTGSG